MNRLYSHLFRILILNFLSLVFVGNSVWGQQDRFIFLYNGPDTIYVGNGCTGILDWGHPDNPEIIPNMPGLVIININILISGGYSIGDPVTAGTTVTVTYRVQDNMGVTTDFTFTIYFDDNIPPVFTMDFPSEVTLSCGEEVAILPGSIADNCTPFEDITLTFTDSDTINFCLSYALLRTWTATDAFGNSSTYEQTLFIEADTEPPVLVLPAEDLTITCSDGNLNTVFNDWVLARGNAVVNDNCPNLTWTTQPALPDLSLSCGASIEVTFIATDPCGNFVSTSASFTYTDDQEPVIMEPPASLVFICDGSDFSDQLYLWLQSTGGALVTDNCLPQEDLVVSALFDGHLLTPEVLDSIIADQLAFSCREDVFLEGVFYSGVLIYLPVTFVFADHCGNEAQDTATFMVLDQEPPVLLTGAEDLIIDCAAPQLILEQLESWILSAGGATGSDDCVVVNFVTQRTLEELIQEFTNIQDTSCGLTGSLEVIFYLEDGCGTRALDSTIAVFSVIDTIPPVIEVEPIDVTLDCSPDIENIFFGLINNQSGAIASDACSEPVWTHFTWEDSNGLSGEALFGDTNAYPFPVAEDCSWSVMLQMFVEDNCGNTAQISSMVTIEDTTSPVFTTLPETISVLCNQIPDPTSPPVEDNCLFNLSVTFEETSDQSPDTLACEHYNYTLVRTWTAEDACGNITTGSQTFLVVDTIGPVINLPANNNVKCTDDISPYMDQIAMLITDNCSPVSSVTFTEVEIGGSCVGNFRVERRWTATDVCGNTSTFIQQFFFTDKDPPTLITEVEDLTVSCNISVDYSALYLEWLNNRGGGTAEDNCSEVNFFAAEPDSYDPQNPATFPGVFPSDPGQGGCNGLFFLDKMVDFVFFDDCGNATKQQGRFIIIDDTPPTIEYCTSQIQANNSPGLCEGEILLLPPVVSEPCHADIISDMAQETLPITSAVPGDPDVIVDPLEFALAVTISPLNTLTAPATLQVSLNMADGEAPTEFFHVYDEDGGYLGRTNNVPEQCGSGNTTFTLNDSESLNRWASDGMIRFRLEPNSPPGQPGRFSVNDICPGGNVTLSLEYERNLPSGLVFEYLTEGHDRITFDPENPPLLTFPVGEQIVTYFIRDCFGNESSCDQQIIVLDTESPVISCPENIVHLLDAESCSWTTLVDLPVSFTDNCVLPSMIQITVPQDTTEAWLTFARDPDLNDYLAKDKIFTFEGLSNLVLGEDVLLTVHLKGDVAEEGAFFSIFDPDNTLLGTTEFISGDCSTEGVMTFALPKDKFIGWAQNGSLAIRAVSNTQFLVPPAGPGSGINPCIPENVNNDGDTDSTSYMFMTLEAAGIQPQYFVTGATEIPLTQTQGTDLRPEITFLPGLSMVHYVGQDASGNADTCIFEVMVSDTVPPVALCNNAIININPSGLISYTVQPDEIDSGSFDNCEIINRTVEPSVFTCSDVGNEVPVTLTVTDISGLTSSCQSIIRIERFPLEPSFILDVCSPDTLRLFANIPDDPAPSNYTFTWTGPNNYSSSQQNPVITGITQAWSGTYTVRAQGFGGCFAEGSVAVIVPEVLGTPDISFGDNPVCQGGLITMETQPFSGNITYNWYRGIAPDGILVASTPAPSYSVNLPPGIYNFYVIAASDFCTSSPSVSRQIRVLSQINASITPDFIEVCEESAIALNTEISGTNITYQWTGPAGFTSVERNPVVTNDAAFSNAGIYTLLILEYGCPSTPATAEVVVKDKPPLPIIVSNNLQCPGNELVLTVNNITDGDQYQWQHPDGTIINTGINVLAVPNAGNTLNGEWTVLVIKDGCASDRSTGIVVDIEQAFDFGATNNGPVCDGDEITLQAGSLPDGSYFWTGPTPNIPEVRNPVFVPSPGIYTVIGITGKGCVYEGQTTVVVNPRPVVTAISNNAPPCVPGNTPGCFQLSVFPSNDGSYMFEWSGPGFSSNEELACIENISSANNGTYSLQVINSFGCPSLSSSIEINVRDIPATPVVQRAAFYCEGEDILFTTSDLGAGVEYTWETPIGTITTNIPELRITNGSGIHNGAYSLMVTVNGCTSEVSAPVDITLRSKPGRPVVSGDALVCAGDTIFLNTGFVPGGTFSWSGPDSFSATGQNTFVFPATSASEGNYTVRVSVEGCLSDISVPFFVKVNPVPITPRLETANDILCARQEGFNLDLCIVQEDVVVGTRYTWYNAQTDMVEAGPFTSRCFNIQDLDRLEDGLNSFYVIASRDGCFSVPTAPLEIRIDKLPSLTAQAGPDLIACDQDEIAVSATAPSAGNGQWIALDNHLGIDMEGDPFAMVFGLRSGENRIAWSLNYRSCLDYSRDTLVITFQTRPVARDDSGEVVPFAGTSRLNVLANDDLPFAFTVDIVIQPMHGTLIALPDNTYDFIADPNYVGTDQFVYRVCATGCPGLCSEAVVRFEIGDESICDIPTIITPNDDGINDLFFIPCLSSNLYPNNRVTIFNEWGTSVFEESPYSNAWDGRYRGQPLPVGTYFYVVEFGDGRKPEAGFLMIKR